MNWSFFTKPNLNIKANQNQTIMTWTPAEYRIQKYNQRFWRKRATDQESVERYHKSVKWESYRKDSSNTCEIMRRIGHRP
jgi:hypothetical protein